MPMCTEHFQYDVSRFCSDVKGTEADLAQTVEYTRLQIKHFIKDSKLKQKKSLPFLSVGGVILLYFSDFEAVTGFPTIQHCSCAYKS